MKNEEKKICFMECYEPVHKRFERFCKARTFGSSVDFKDLMHDTIVIAYNKFETVNQAAFLHFLFGISIRLLANQVRKKKPQSLESYPEDNRLQTNDSGESKHDVEILYKALGKLPDEQRECVILYEISGFSIKEIAELQHAGESAVKQRLARGRQKLKELLTERAVQEIA